MTVVAIVVACVNVDRTVVVWPPIVLMTVVVIVMDEMEGKGAEEITVYILVDVAAEEGSDEVKNEEEGSKVYVVEAAVLGIKLEAEEDSTEVLGPADVGEVNTELSVGTTLFDSKIDVDDSGTLVDSEETSTDDTGILFDAVGVT